MTLELEKECGVTQISLSNSRILIDRYGLPDGVRIFQDQGGGEHCVEAVWKLGILHTFTGFSWGYGGEGPHGLQQFLTMLGFCAPVSIQQIVRWPQDGFPALTYLRGEDYGCTVSAGA